MVRGSTRSGFLSSFTTKKCQGKDNMWWGTHFFWFRMSWVFSASHAIFASTSKLIRVTMLSKVDDPLTVEIEPTYGFQSLSKFPNSKWASP
jgi:hypothetical protein